MKKISTLLLSSLFSLSLLAHDGSRLTITAVTNTLNLKVEVDGQRMKMYDNSISLRNLGEGYHLVKIFRERKRGNSFGNGFGFGRRDEMIYNSSVFLKRGFELDILVNRFGKVFTDENRIDRNSEWFDGDDDRSYDDHRYDDNSDGGWNNGYGNVMSAKEFESLKEQIRKEWFEANKLISVKTIADKNNFTTQQVKDLMYLFTFENNRLEVAKYVYRKTADKENYYRLNDALTFNSSKEELARFIRESR